jgi:hypothetical protein
MAENEKLGAMNSHAVRCPKCNVTARVPLAARANQCKNCGAQLTVPESVRAAGQKRATTIRSVGIVIGLAVAAFIAYAVLFGSKGYDSEIVGVPSCAGGQCELVVDVTPKSSSTTESATCTVSGLYGGTSQVIGTFQAGPFSAGTGKEVRWLTPSLPSGQPASWSVSCK